MAQLPKMANEKNADQYYKIRVGSLHPSLPIPFDIFVSINGRYIHYLRAGSALSKEKLDSFDKKAPDSFFIEVSQRLAYKKFIHDQLANENFSSQEKAIILKESSFALIEEMFESANMAYVLNESKALIEDFITFMSKEPGAMSDLIGLSSHDFYTYNHSLDVSIYSIGLGRAAGYSGEALKELGRGALFHDIGKRYISLDIITKEGPLTDKEWEEMKKHPQYGLMILSDYDVSDNIRACVFEHHENIIGNGYPQNLKGDEIHPMARIVALADTYDALTTKRSYNEPISPTDAIKLMNEKLAGRFDPNLLKIMTEIMSKIKRP